MTENEKNSKRQTYPSPPPPADTITNINLILKSVLTRKETSDESQHVPASLPARVGEDASTSGDLKGCFSLSFSISLR